MPRKKNKGKGLRGLRHRENQSQGNIDSAEQQSPGNPAQIFGRATSNSQPSDDLQDVDDTSNDTDDSNASIIAVTGNRPRKNKRKCRTAKQTSNLQDDNAQSSNTQANHEARQSSGTESNQSPDDLNFSIKIDAATATAIINYLMSNMGQEQHNDQGEATTEHHDSQFGATAEQHNDQSKTTIEPPPIEASVKDQLTSEAKDFVKLWPYLAGDSNLPNREEKKAARENTLRALGIDDPQTLANAEIFQEKHLFTSRIAVEKYFSKKDVELLAKMLPLGKVKGREAPESDMCQQYLHKISGFMVSMGEKLCFDALREIMPDELEADGIDEPFSYESTTTRMLHYFKKKEVQTFLEERFPSGGRFLPGHNHDAFIKTMREFCQMRNDAVHRNKRTMAFLYRVAEVLTALFQTLAPIIDPPELQRFRDVKLAFSRYEDWNVEEKEVTLKHLLNSFSNLENHKAKSLRLPVRYSSHDQILQNGKKIHGKMTADRRKTTWENMGELFSDHIIQILKGKTTEKFSFENTNQQLLEASLVRSLKRKRDRMDDGGDERPAKRWCGITSGLRSLEEQILDCLHGIQQMTAEELDEWFCKVEVIFAKYPVKVPGNKNRRETETSIEAWLMAQVPDLSV